MTSLKMIVLWVFLVVCVAAISNAAPGVLFIDHGEVHIRPNDNYIPIGSGGGSYGKGHVGPVYSFVKTDPKANFKWRVHHLPGFQYGR